MLHIEPINAFNDNYIWCLYDDQSRQALVVDPGDANPVESMLQSKQLNLTALLITHHHADHIGGIDRLLDKYPVPVYGPRSKNIPQITDALGDRDSLQVLGLNFQILTIPGHTLDHIAFYCAQSVFGPLVFCGDTLFAGGCGRVFEGNPAMMLQSLNKLATLPANTRVYCAHEYTLANLAFAKTVEPDNAELLHRIENDSLTRTNQQPTVPSTVKLELATNPFLRCSQPSVIASASRHASLPKSDPVDVFAVIRGWKDNF